MTGDKNNESEHYTDTPDNLKLQLIEAMANIKASIKLCNVDVTLHLKVTREGVNMQMVANKAIEEIKQLLMANLQGIEFR